MASVICYTTLTVLQVTFTSVGYRFTRTLVFFNVTEVKCQIVLYLWFKDFNIFQFLVLISIAVTSIHSFFDEEPRIIYGHKRSSLSVFFFYKESLIKLYPSSTKGLWWCWRTGISMQTQNTSLRGQSKLNCGSFVCLLNHVFFVLLVYIMKES